MIILYEYANILSRTVDRLACSLQGDPQQSEGFFFAGLFLYFLARARRRAWSICFPSATRASICAGRDEGVGRVLRNAEGAVDRANLWRGGDAQEGRYRTS